MTEILRRCAKCKIDRLQSEYRPRSYVRKDGTRGLSAYCNYCDNALTAEWRAKNRQKSRDNVRRAAMVREFGITPEQYDDLLSSQGGGCAICGGHDGWRRLAIDHDHKSGRVRGLLCAPCNLRLGWVEANRDAIDDYLDS